MLKVLKTLVFLALFVGFLGGAYFGFQHYLNENKDGGIFAPVLTFGFRREATPAEPAAAKAAGDLSGIVAEYRAAMTAAKASPDGVAAVKKEPEIPVPGDDVKVIREWKTGKKWVALTFDDGPHPEYTPRFMALLKEKNVPATFFLIGKQVASFPELTRKLVDEGFEIANHTWTHPQLTRIKAETAVTELENTTRAIEEAASVKVELLRPPYGATNDRVLSMTQGMGLRVINWNIDTNDWRTNTTADSITSEILKYARDGSIVLMHDRYEKSLEATSRSIDLLRADGYEFVTVSTLLGIRKPGEPQPAIARAAAPDAPAEDSILPGITQAPAEAGSN